MRTSYNRLTYLKRKIGDLEKRMAQENSEEKRKWIFWEIENYHREMDRFKEFSLGKKNL